MKKKRLNFYCSLLIICCAFNLNAQNTNSANTSSSAFATIVAPLGIKHTGNDLEFGTIIKGSGTVTLATNETRSFSNPSLNPGDQGISPALAVFTVSGEGIYTYSIAFANATEVLSNGESTMEVSDFVALSSDGEGLTRTLSNGTDQIQVGATLTLDNDETIGTYTGSFSITVAYN
jgi:hypothetical protein